MLKTLFETHGTKIWRQTDPESVTAPREELDELVANLAPHTPVPCSTVPADLLTRAAGGSGTAAFDLACHLLSERLGSRDLALTWLCVAGLRLNKQACGILMRVCLDEAAQLKMSAPGDRNATLVWLRKALSWGKETPEFRSIEQSYDEYLLREATAEDIASSFESGGTPLVRLFVQRCPVADKVGDIEAKPPTEPSVTVVETISDTESFEGRRIKRSYEALTEPLLLKQTPLAPNTICDLLLRDFPWMKTAIELLREDLELQAFAGRDWFRVEPMLLVGPPGCGKTAFAQTLSKLSGVGFGMIDAAGSSENRLLAGTARGWSSAQPAYPLLAMLRTFSANPLILVDEIDKATGSQNGDIRATLLGMLEPQTNRVWPDECLLSACDLSYVSWIMTANDADRIPRPLRSRLRSVHVHPPGPSHASTILCTLEREMQHELCLPSTSELPLPSQVRDTLTDALRRGANIRRVKQALRSATAHSLGDNNKHH